MIYLTMSLSSNIKGYNIIMVDDDEDDIFIMRKELRKVGIGDESFSAVTGGPELLKLLQEAQEETEGAGPDLILLDINMPRMDGFEVLAQLKSDEKVRDIPVIMFSTSSQSSDVKKSFTLGAEDYLVKPRELNEFRDIIARIRTFLINRGRWPGSEAGTTH